VTLVNNKPVISFIQQQKTQRIKPSSIWKKSVIILGYLQRLFISQHSFIQILLWMHVHFWQMAITLMPSKSWNIEVN